jgi:hypothetical protein
MNQPAATNCERASYLLPTRRCGNLFENASIDCETIITQVRRSVKNYLQLFSFFIFAARTG